MIKFTQITDKLKYPQKHKSTLQLYHSSVIELASKEFINKNIYKRKVIDSINTITYLVIFEDFMPLDWDESSPMDNLPDIDTFEVKEKLDKLNLYLDVNNIDWDVVESAHESSMYVSADSDNHKQKLKDSNITSSSSVNKQKIVAVDSSNSTSVKQSGGDLISIESVNSPSKLVLGDMTPKEDLYIQYPVIPRFNISNVLASGKDGNDVLAIYKTLPEVPNKQSEISITTDVNLFRESDFMKLFPKQFIPTRNSSMYVEVPGLNYHNELGVIIPILKYSEEQIIDNIVKYPHIYQLLRYIDDKYVTFYSTIEIDGKLERIQDVWDDLEDTQNIPKTLEFMKEYVVRRYLLERDIDGVDHRYKLWGTLDPFLTLFTTPEDYIRLGYTNVVELARQCVLSRVSYRRSRNPVLRRLNCV